MEAESGLLVAEASGEFDVDDLIRNFGRIVEATKGAALHACHLFVADENLSLHEFDIVALSRIAGVLGSWGKIYPGRDVRTAFVLPGGPGQHLTIEMWKALTELDPAATGTHVRVFAEEGAARAWLMEKQRKRRPSGAG
jgi:hypothetical protein